MHNGSLIAAVAALAIPLAGSAEDRSTSYLCISAQSTGFAYDNARHDWNVTRFAAGKKYIVRRVTKDTIAEFDAGIRVPLRSAWAVWNFGNDKVPFAECQKDFEENGMLFCEGEPSLHFQFSRRTGRFISGTVYGYVFGAVSAPATFGAPAIDWPEGSNTPFMEIGTCSAI